MWRLKRPKEKEKVVKINRSDIQLKANDILTARKLEYVAQVGRGAFADVLVFWSLDEQITVAAKVMHPVLSSAGELKLWPNFKHPNIMPLLRTIRRKEVNIFLMPYVSRSLMDILGDTSFRNDPNSYSLTIGWIADFLRGLEYLHGMKICHLDVKVDNILVTTTNSAVICDFSTVEEVKGLTNRFVLPTYYCPPEAWSFERDGPIPKVNGIALDIWSAGMLIFYIFSNQWMEQHLWGYTNWWIEIYPLIYRCFQFEFFQSLMKKAFPLCKITSVICSHALNLQKGILRYKPEDRPSMSRLLSHILLSGNEKDLLETDLMWSADKKEIKRQVIKGKLDLIIRKALFIVEKKKEVERSYEISKKPEETNSRKSVGSWIQEQWENLRTCSCC